MHFSVLPPWAAPVSTGHPFGLPEASAQTKSVKRVPTVAQQNSSDTSMAQEKSPTQFWRFVAGEPDPINHVAPPSIMQLKISAMLDQQAPLLTEEAENAAPEPEAAVPADSPREKPGTDKPVDIPVVGYAQVPEWTRGSGTTLEDTTA